MVGAGRSRFILLSLSMLFRDHPLFPSCPHSVRGEFSKLLGQQPMQTSICSRRVPGVPMPGLRRGDPRAGRGPRRVSSMCDHVWAASPPEAGFPFCATGRTPASLYLMLSPRAKGLGYVAGIWGRSVKSLQGWMGQAQTLELGLETREKDSKVPSCASVRTTGKARSTPAGSCVDAWLPLGWGGHPSHVICRSEVLRQERFSLALIHLQRLSCLQPPWRQTAKLL